MRQLGNPSGLLGRFILWRLNAVNRGMNDLAYKALDLTGEDRVLEIGFGGGDLIGRMLSSGATHVAGTEISDLAVRRAAKRFRGAVDRGGLDLSICDGVSLPFDSGAFSRVCCVNVIYFWRDVPAMVAEVHRVLAGGGKFAVCYQDDAPDGVTKFPPSRVEAYLTAAGFTDIATIDAADKESESYHCTVATK